MTVVVSSVRPPLFTPRFVALLLVQSAYGTAISTFYVLPRFLLEHLSASSALVSNAHGAFALSGALVVPWIGPWIDRVGARRTLLAGVILGASTFFLTGYAEPPALMLLLRALHGVSFSLVFTSGSVLAVDYSPRERRAEAIGYFGTAMLVTNAFGPTLAEYLLTFGSWQRVFWMCSAFSAVALLPILSIALPDNASVLTGTSSEAAPSPTFLTRPPWNRALGGCYVAFAALGIGVGASKTYVPALMVSSGMREISGYFISFTCGALLQRTVFGWVPDRVGYRRATVVALLFYALSMLGFFVLPLNFVYAASFALGIAHGAAYPATVALSMGCSTAAERGRVASWSTGFYNFGFAVAGSGLVWFEPSLGYGGLVAIAGLLIAGSAVWALAVTRQ
jgi:MFS family permease